MFCVVPKSRSFDGADFNSTSLIYSQSKLQGLQIRRLRRILLGFGLSVFSLGTDLRIGNRGVKPEIFFSKIRIKGFSSSHLRLWIGHKVRRNSLDQISFPTTPSIFERFSIPFLKAAQKGQLDLPFFQKIIDFETRRAVFIQVFKNKPTKNQSCFRVSVTMTYISFISTSNNPHTNAPYPAK